MHERQIRWNERYARGEETYDYRPSPPLPEAVQGLGAGESSQTPGLALDIACGAGRHSIYLAERGFRVVAVDWAQAGIDALLAEARRRGVADRIETVVADLEAGELDIEPSRYDVVCDFYFLSRPLFPAMRGAVRPGGLFVAAIHVQSPSAAAPHRFLLEPGELRRTVLEWGFEVLHERDGESQEQGHQHATAEIVARRPPAG
jgi:tellurite methyltransferase